MAIAASMLTACFFMLRDEVPYKDLGAQHFDRHDTGKTIGRLVKRLEALGCEVGEVDPIGRTILRPSRFATGTAV